MASRGSSGSSADHWLGLYVYNGQYKEQTGGQDSSVWIQHNVWIQCLVHSQRVSQLLYFFLAVI